MRNLKELIIEKLRIGKSIKVIDVDKVSMDSFNLFFEMCEYIHNDKILKNIINMMLIERENSNGNSTILFYNVNDNSINDIPLNDFKSNFSINSHKQLLYKNEKLKIYGNKGLTINNPNTITVGLGLNDRCKNWEKLFNNVQDVIDKDKCIYNIHYYPLLYKLEKYDYHALFDLAKECQ